MADSKTGKQSLIFLVHAEGDKSIVRALSKRLKNDGFELWLADERILPGQEWPLEIEKALRNCGAILLTFSKNSSIEEGYFQRVYRQALEYQMQKPQGTIFVIPVRLDDSEIPFFLRNIQCVDYPSGYDRLLLSLDSLRARNTLPPSSRDAQTAAQDAVPEDFIHVQLVLEGDFKEFDQTRREDLILVLASLLRVDLEDIRILQVHPGSIIVNMAMSEIAINRLKVLARKGDFRLKAKGIISIQVMGESIFPLYVPDAELSKLYKAKASTKSILSKFKYDAFISYSHKDRDVVDRLIERLRADGFQLWVDEEQIGGDPLRRFIVNGIQQSRHVIICFSPSYLESKWTTLESAINQTIDVDNRDRRIIPVKVAPVEIPVEYRQYYRPDLTIEDTWEQEYQQTVKNIRPSRPIPDWTEIHPEPPPEERLSEPGVVPFQPQPPESTSRLASMGFRYHPFAWPDAERMNLDVLEQTYTPPSRFNETVMDLGSSTALLAPFGGGKTAGRLRLTASLMKKQAELLKESTKEGRAGNVPLVVQYTDFERLYSQLPAIKIESHQPLLLACIAESLREFIGLYPERFMTLSEKDRDFWWAFLEQYRLGITLIASLRDEILLKDYQRISSRPNPFIHSTSLARILQVLVEQLHPLNIQSLIILVDGVDAQTQTQIDMERITLPLFNHLGILSVPGVIWKFFLPDMLENMVRQSSSYRTGRLKILHIQWSQEALKQFLVERLLWASEGGISDIAQHCDQKLIMELGDVDAELAKLALTHDVLGSPRAMLELADELYHYGGQDQITLEDWKGFLLQTVADS